MARPGLMRHKKFARLARLIGNEVLARGHLELLWEVAYENGDDLVGDAGDLEHLTKWDGEPGALAAAMTQAGFVDQEEGGQYRVHDLWDHAPDYVRRRRQRENERQEKGAGLRRSVVSDQAVTGQSPTDAGQRPPNGRPRAPAPAPAPTQEATAAARACARSDDSPKLGLGVAEAAPPPPAVEAAPGPISMPPPPVADDPAGEVPLLASPAGGGGLEVLAGTAGPGEEPASGPSNLIPTPAAVGHPAEAANPSSAQPARSLALVVDDEPLRPVPTLDTTELDELGATLRWRLERRAEWKFLVAAHERKAEVRSKLEGLVAELGVDRAEALCWAALERRKRQDLQPPKAVAFFVGLLEEAAKGGDPCPAEVAGVDVDQVRAACDAEVLARWAPLLDRMNPAQREAYELEKARLASEIMSQGLWTSEETRQLEQAEGFLFDKWSRRAAAGSA